MIYKLYRKANDEDAGQVLAIVAQTEARVNIDDIELYVFKNGNPVEFEFYSGDRMKMAGEGRPLWSVITWPLNHKWEELAEIDDIMAWSKEFNAGKDSTAGNLQKFFNS
ncbi:hypothetical protein ACQ86K_01305 [Mucilaginibacter sp. P19]|uniref:hypothetical protein n=1 Tax=Mucilaginibacter sp. P19 TaxID=3423947 RepID=UPI003D66F30A